MVKIKKKKSKTKKKKEEERKKERKVTALDMFIFLIRWLCSCALPFSFLLEWSKIGRMWNMNRSFRFIIYTHHFVKLQLHLDISNVQLNFKYSFYRKVITAEKKTQKEKGRKSGTLSEWLCSMKCLDYLMRLQLELFQVCY